MKIIADRLVQLIIKNNNTIYTVDTDGLLSAIDLTNGNVKWAIPTNREISSGLSVLNDSICLGTARAKLICHNIKKNLKSREL